MATTKRLFILVLHIFVGIIASEINLLAALWIVSAFFLGIRNVIKNKNRNNEALVFSAYIIALEVFTRIYEAYKYGVFSEFGKYAASTLLIIGLLYDDKGRKKPASIIVYFVLLIPSIIMMDFSDLNYVRQQISFNLSGPFMLFISVLYFYKRKIKKKEFERFIFVFSAPVLATSVAILFNMPDFDTIVYTSDSNSQTSGGFGPNQVSTIFGFAGILIPFSFFLRLRVTGLRIVDLLLFFLFLGNAIFSFSRGGVMVPLVALVLAFLVQIFLDSKTSRRIVRLITLTIFGGILIFTFNYINDITGNKLLERYTGSKDLDAMTGTEIVAIEVASYNTFEGNKSSTTKYLTGRDLVVQADLFIFQNNMVMGVGPGMANKLRAIVYGKEVSAHVEFSRMLAEHGFFGIVSLILMIFMPIVFFFKTKNKNSKIIVVLFSIFSFGTMTHAAMRLAIPGFVYGFAFIHLLENNPLKRTKK